MTSSIAGNGPRIAAYIAGVRDWPLPPEAARPLARSPAARAARRRPARRQVRHQILHRPRAAWKLPVGGRFRELWHPGPAVCATARKVSLAISPEMGCAVARLALDFADGHSAAAAVPVAKGHPGNPRSWDDMQARRP